jgi:pimeloyl-ACP methyl ester carboxylesterase
MTSKNELHIVLVHGGFVDGSGWESVYQLLKREGYRVSVTQHTTASLSGDVAAVKRALATQNGPAILVGHSYGGAVISEAGNDPHVVALVYIAGFVPNDGESVQTLIKDPAPGAPVPPILPPQDGLLTLDKTKFPASFAGDLDADKAAFLADSQLPWGVAGLAEPVRNAAWRNKPSWYLVTTEDKMIPPDAQRQMAKRAGATVIEERGSHSIYISKPAAVAAFVARAANDAIAAAA